MTLGFVPGAGPLHRAHPFTSLTIAMAAAILAFALPLPLGPAIVFAVAIVLAASERIPRLFRTAAWSALPFWFFLLLIHGWVRHLPLLAIGLGFRISSIILVFLAVLASIHPGRLVDALVERGIPFSAAYLFAATLQAVPRLRRRAKEILDAQRCRGLAVSGSPLRRARAVVPLAIPLILGALAEVDERAVALEARGAGHVARRTPLDPPRDSPLQRAVRWGLVAIAVAAVTIRLAQ